MAWTGEPRTWVTGEVVGAADMNAEVRDRIAALAALIGPGVGVEFLGAGKFESVQGTPDRAERGSGGGALQMLGWALDPSTIEAVSTTLYVPFDPSLCTMTAKILWAPATTNTGVVRWNLLTADVASGEQIDQTADETDTQEQAGSGTAENLHITSAMTLTRTGRFWRLCVQREANHANDTFTGDAWFLGLLIEPTVS